MLTFKPRSVPPKRVLQWVQEALSISSRNWYFAVFTVVPLLFLSAEIPSWLTMFLLPMLVTVLLAFFCVLAHAQDNKQTPLTALAHSMPGIARILMYVLMMEVLIALLFGLGFQSSENVANAFLNAGTKVSEFSPGTLAMVVMGTAWVLVPMDLFFLMPLLSIAGLRFMTGYELSKQGFRLNRYIFIISLAAAVVTIVSGALHGLTAVPFIPITGAFLYVAYRDVFLHRSEPASQPQAEKSLSAESAATPAN